jgi:DNA-binding NtrC family response regulator
MQQNNHLKIYILEDDRWYGAILEHHLSNNPNYQVLKFEKERDFFIAMYDVPDVVTLDYSLKEMDGGQVLQRIKEISPTTEVIIISGQRDVATAVKLLKAGSFDYIVKDDDTIERLLNVMLHLQEIKYLQKEVDNLKIALKNKFNYANSIIGQSEAIFKVHSLIEKASKTNITVSLNGQSGTGKEMVAKSIHYHSIRHQQPFIIFNGAAFSADLLEAELFGYEKNAFIGASEKRIGKFEQANKGTLFIKEITELDLSLQAKLLRVLQEREFSRLGSSKLIPIDIRIIVSTQFNLLEEVNAKRFREDLYYRILGLTIELSPLQSRGNDILILAKYFLDIFCTENKIPTKSFSQAALKKLQAYSYPGNVRELKSIMELAAVLSDSNIINENDINIEATSVNASALLQTESTLREYELKIINHFMEKYNDDILTVAKKLGIGKSTIYRLIQNGELKQK